MKRNVKVSLRVLVVFILVLIICCLQTLAPDVLARTEHKYASNYVPLSSIYEPAPPSQTIIQRTSNRLNTGISDSNPYKTSSQFSAEMDSYNAIGVGWIRLDFNWSRIQSLNANYYNLEYYDMLVKTANKFHIQVLGILDYSPNWAAKVGCDNASSCAPNDPAAYASFAKYIASHYRNTVNHWEIWNEENGNYWSPRPDVVDYAKTLKLTYEAIKTVSPEASVILGGMASGDNTAKHNIDAVKFLQGIYTYGAGHSFDAISYHPYTYPNTPMQVGTGKGWAKIEKLRDIMVANGDSSKQIWITEFGAPTSGPAGSGYVTELDQANEVTEVTQALLDKPWIGPVFWYTYRDYGTDTSTKENFFGLRRYDGTPKPAYYTLKNILKNQQ